jgi:hypothetical protein
MDLAVAQFRRVDPPVISSAAATGHPLPPEYTIFLSSLSAERIIDRKINDGRPPYIQESLRPKHHVKLILTAHVFCMTGC